jgi:hypothetical protein
VAGAIDRGVANLEVRTSEAGSVAETTVGVSPGAAWRVLPQAYDSLGLGGGVLDAGELSYGNNRVTARNVAGNRTDRLFRCANEGAGPSAVNRFRIRFSISTTVTEGPEGHAVLFHEIVATGTPIEGTSSGRVICVSRGQLESAIQQQVAFLAVGGG